MTDNPIELLKEEHTLIRKAVTGIQELLAGKTLDAGLFAERAHSLARLLALHERREDDVLFPAVGTMGPVQLVMQEHAHLSALLDNMNQALANFANDGGDEACNKLKVAFDEVAYCLAGHLMKEEQMAFRMAEGMISPEQFPDMLERMRAIG
ncbi:MAG: hemerythrin domain-containing protein [Leptospirillia bacterium]